MLFVSHFQALFKSIVLKSEQELAIGPSNQDFLAIGGQADYRRLWERAALPVEIKWQSCQYYGQTKHRLARGFDQGGYYQHSRDNHE
jgi:hypothetical protein